MHIYDYIIIGSGLTGQTIATQLSQETKNVLLLEGESFTGGSNRPAILAGQIHDAGMRFLPATDLSKKTIKAIENVLGLKLIKHEIENHVETYEASGFKSFVGFGDHPPAFYDQFNYFLSPKELELTLPVHQILSLLKDKYLGETMTRSHATKFVYSEVEEGHKGDYTIDHVIVNGAKQLHARNFIFTGNVRDLALIVPDDILNIRAKTKLKKDSYWMSVCLDLYTEDVTVEKNNLHVLDGTVVDDIGPCVGRFLPAVTAENSPTNKAFQFSQWLGFIDLNTSEETENIGEVLKKMKRQIKRAFPEMAEAIKAERIFVSPPMTGGELKLNSNGTLHKTNNLWISSAQKSAFPNILGAFLQAEMTLAALGFSGGISATEANPADASLASDEFTHELQEAEFVEEEITSADYTEAEIEAELESEA